MKSAANEKNKKRLNELTAGQIMRRPVVSVSPTAPLSEVERLLTENRISGMPVTNSAGHAIGVISYRDLLDHYAQNPDEHPHRKTSYFRVPTEQLADEEFEGFSVPEASEDRVEDAMTPEVIHVGGDATLRQVARTMRDHAIHRVLVIDPGSGRVLGIISTMDVLASLAG